MTIRQQLSVKQYEEAVNFAGRRHPFNYSVIPDGSGSSVTGTITDAKKKRGQIVMYGAIGMDWFGDGITAKSFEKELKALGAVDELEIRINSEGGSVHDARAIYNLLNVHKARKEVHIDSLAASAASFVAMAGDSITIAESGFFMIHNARMFAGGTAEDFDAAANFLRTVNRTIADTYVARTGVSAEKIKKWMDAETWFTGQEALDAGFATAIVENKQGGEAKAKTVSPLFNYAHVPAAIRANRAKALALMGR